MKKLFKILCLTIFLNAQSGNMIAHEWDMEYIKSLSTTQKIFLGVGIICLIDLVSDWVIVYANKQDNESIQQARKRITQERIAWHKDKVEGMKNKATKWKQDKKIIQKTIHDSIK